MPTVPSLSGFSQSQLPILLVVAVWARASERLWDEITAAGAGQGFGQGDHVPGQGDVHLAWLHLDDAANALYSELTSMAELLRSRGPCFGPSSN